MVQSRDKENKVEADDDTESQRIQRIDMLRCRVEAYRYDGFEFIFNTHLLFFQGKMSNMWTFTLVLGKSVALV